MRRWIAISVVIVIAIFAAFLLRPAPEPEYRGRSLSSWLRQATEPARHSKVLNEARAAIRAIGPAEVVPRLLRLAASRQKQRTLRDWMTELTRRFGVYAGPVFQSNEPQYMAVAGFQALGPDAAEAVPALADMCNEPDRSMVALQCLAAIGPAAKDAICAALTNRDMKVRAMAIWSTPAVVTNKATLFATITPSVNDSDPSVHAAVIEVVGAQASIPEKAVPWLTDIVRRADTNDAPLAAMHLQNFGTNGLIAFATLTNAVEEAPYSALAQASLRTLMQMAPDRVLPILTRHLHSIDPFIRSQALMLLIREYPNPTEVVPAVQYAAEDPEEIIATRAERFLERINPGPSAEGPAPK
jgi:hypothetical protein